MKLFFISLNFSRKGHLSMKLVFISLVSMYIGAGIFGAALMSQALPLNILGQLYLVVAWPKTIYCANVENNCSPVPPVEWAPYLFDVK